MKIHIEIIGQSDIESDEAQYNYQCSEVDNTYLLPKNIDERNLCSLFTINAYTESHELIELEIGKLNKSFFVKKLTKWLNKDYSDLYLNSSDILGIANELKKDLTSYFSAFAKGTLFGFFKQLKLPGEISNSIVNDFSSQDIFNIALTCKSSADEGRRLYQDQKNQLNLKF